jgi:hypothetical protein
MTPGKHGTLVRESRWMRVYQTGPQELHYESKFISENIEISVVDLKLEWEGFTEQDRLDFAQAFSSRGLHLPQDQEIVEFLMESGPEIVWSTIAPLLPSFHDREKAVSFLLARITEEPANCANYYQVAELIADRRAIPALQQRFDEYLQRLRPMESRSIFELADYLSCCGALWKLDGSPQYERALRNMLKHPDGNVRQWAESFLSHEATR